MSEYLPIVITSIILAFISHAFSGKRKGVYSDKESFFWFVMTICMVFFVGLRHGYNDTSAYRQMYQDMQIGDTLFSTISWKLGLNPGFWAVNEILKRWHFSVQSFLMFYAAVTVSIHTWFIRKYSENLWLSIFLLFTLGLFSDFLAATKQCVAVAFCLVATDRWIREKKFAFVFWVVFGSLFHPYALMYLAIPWLSFRPWCKKTWVLLLGFMLFGFTLNRFLGTLVSITSMMGEDLTVAELTEAGVNPFRVAVCFAPVLLSYHNRRALRSRDDSVNNLFLNLSVLSAAIMFVALFGTANYFGRLSNYFLFFQILTLPWIINNYEPVSKRFITRIVVVCYSLYFVYAYAVRESFDATFSSVKLSDYLSSIF